MADRHIQSVAITSNRSRRNGQPVVVQRLGNRFATHALGGGLLQIKGDGDLLLGRTDQLRGGNTIDLLQLGNHGVAHVLRRLEGIAIARHANHGERNIGGTTGGHLRCGVLRERVLDLGDRLLDLRGGPRKIGSVLQLHGDHSVGGRRVGGGPLNFGDRGHLLLDRSRNALVNLLGSCAGRNRHDGHRRELNLRYELLPH